MSSPQNVQSVKLKVTDILGKLSSSAKSYKNLSRREVYTSTQFAQLGILFVNVTKTFSLFTPLVYLTFS